MLSIAGHLGAPAGPSWVPDWAASSKCDGMLNIHLVLEQVVQKQVLLLSSQCMLIAQTAILQTHSWDQQDAMAYGCHCCRLVLKEVSKVMTAA